jgi:hypothetical protein
MAMLEGPAPDDERTSPDVIAEMTAIGQATPGGNRLN